MSLRQRNEALKSLTATVKIGIPHPQAKLIQWTDALIFWQHNPEHLYVKGYKPLIPIYFLLESKEGSFQLFFARPYIVYHGKNKVLEREIDIDLKLVPQDLMQALALPDIGIDREVERILTPGSKPGQAYVLLVKHPNGNSIRQITVDLSGNPQKTLEFNEAGFPSVEITRDKWKEVGGISYPFQIKIKRLLPRPNEIFLEVKEIRPNAALSSKLYAPNFPENAQRIELT